MLYPNAFEDAVVRVAMKNADSSRGDIDELFAYLRTLELPVSDYAVFGSGPLIIRGFIQGTNDLDVVCRGDAWRKACATGRVSYDERYDVSLASHHDGRITFGTTWGIGEFDTDELIDTAELIDGLPFVQLRHVIAYKTIRSSAKDQLHLAQYREALDSTNAG